jgi:rhodanese-related sulfurtransferase
LLFSAFFNIQKLYPKGGEMCKKISLFLLVMFVFSVGLCWAEERGIISGIISSGFRVLDVNPAKDSQLMVYRGDYIKFRYPKKFASLAFSIPELKYKDTLFPEPIKSPFFKMKAIGTYSFTLGETGGNITVIDLVRTNYTEVTADEAVDLLNNLRPFILDVRTPKEYGQAHIEGSKLIPIQQLQSRIDELESKKHEDIFIYCATGNRSTVASRILADSGFKRIYNLRYGIYDWARRGHPYKTGN